MRDTHITRTEYNQARDMASSALLAFNTGDRDTLTLIVSRALDNQQGAKEYARDASVVATWGALAHTASTMARGNIDRASEVRAAFFSSLESAKKLARKGSK